MKIRSVSSAQGSRGDAVFVLCPDGRVDAGDALADALKAAKATGDLKTSFRAVAVFHQPKGRGPKRLGTVGLGKAQDVCTEKLRRAAALAQGRAEGCEAAELTLVVPANAVKKSKPLAAGMAIAEGLVLGAYRYEPPRKDKPKKRHAQRAAVAVVGLDQKAEAEFARGLRLGALSAGGTVFARDLENQPANILTPTAMASHARRLAGGRLSVKVLDEIERSDGQCGGYCHRYYPPRRGNRFYNRERGAGISVE